MCCSPRPGVAMALAPTAAAALHPPAVLSAKIYQGLLNIGMIDQQGNVLEDPRWVVG